MERVKEGYLMMNLDQWNLKRTNFKQCCIFNGRNMWENRIRKTMSRNFQLAEATQRKIFMYEGFGPVAEQENQKSTVQKQYYKQ